MHILYIYMSCLKMIMISKNFVELSLAIFIFLKANILNKIIMQVDKSKSIKNMKSYTRGHLNIGIKVGSKITSWTGSMKHRWRYRPATVNTLEKHIIKKLRGIMKFRKVLKYLIIT